MPVESACLQIGVTDASFLKAWHPDAMDYFNTCSDLERVVKDMKDPNVRHAKQACPPDCVLLHSGFLLSSIGSCTWQRSSKGRFSVVDMCAHPWWKVVGEFGLL